MSEKSEVVHSSGDEVHLTVEQMREYVEELLPLWIQRLGCPHWSISVTYGPCSNPDWSAQCSRQVAYDVAEITLDPAHHDSKEEIERSLIHELLHVKLAVFDLYRNVVTQNRLPGTAADREESALWEFTIEQAVKDLRRMVSGMGGLF
ncbi:hypothetical protein [Deinococcus sp. Leaf326]|uniref:hypothetical protein n=1 Tax=Deinococcus sp. Leaf326 TaxID=1736338 RepID=UPI0006F2F2BD|nr:hypothetical protein [Deinococcus sp. Leaf326]KQR22876.1 hypothetical protein ASF71_06835 [Deinococcus sp. Leaf326]